ESSRISPCKQGAQTVFSENSRMGSPVGYGTRPMGSVVLNALREACCIPTRIQLLDGNSRREIQAICLLAGFLVPPAPGGRIMQLMKFAPCCFWRAW
ncbi:MAG: hypothetical protein N2C14_09065, partial [Planctomycetales bacterium]